MEVELVVKENLSWEVRQRKGSRRGSFGGRAGRPVEGEELGLVALDGVEEGVVVSGAGGGDLTEEEIHAARGGDGVSLGGVMGGERGVVAYDRSAGGRLSGCAGREM